MPLNVVNGLPIPAGHVVEVARPGDVSPDMIHVLALGLVSFFLANERRISENENVP